MLYITYDGLLEPLGQSQVLAYVELLAEEHECCLISFEKDRDWADSNAVTLIRSRVAAAGIDWWPLRYHKRPTVPATAYDTIIGTAIALWLGVTRDVEIIHARSYVPSLIALASRVLRRSRYLFDMRGFWVDERVDGGMWKRNSALFVIGKGFERVFLSQADYIVSLTNAAVREMQRFLLPRNRRVGIKVIPTCTDLDKFCFQARARETFTLGYVGTLGGWYDFKPAALAFQLILQHIPQARFVVLTRDAPELVDAEMERLGVRKTSFEVRAARHDTIGREIGRMHAAVFFIRPTFSKIASAPTKLGEFLACGVPCLSNHGVGDMAAVLEDNGVGVAIRSFEANEVAKGVDLMLRLVSRSETRSRCRAVAERMFSLREGAREYSNVYAALAEKEDSQII